MTTDQSKGPERLKKVFRCPRCHGQDCLVRRVALPTYSLTKVIPLASGKFFAVTCILCGYTELYDECVYEKQNAKAAEDDLQATQEA